MAIISNDVAARQDMRARRGDTFRRSITAKNDDGSPKSLTGYSFRMELRNAKSGAAVLSFSAGSGITVAGNIITFEKSATQMKVPAGAYLYDLQATYPDGSISTWLVGTFYIIDDITV